MTRADLELLHDTGAFNPSPRHQTLYATQVPFATMTGDRGCEQALAAALRRHERVALLGTSGAGKSNVIAATLHPLVEDLVPLPVPVAVERPDVAGDPAAGDAGRADPRGGRPGRSPHRPAARRAGDRRGTRLIEPTPTGLSDRRATLTRMVMLGVHVGAREDDGDPVAEAAASGADGVQVFLADPQGWKTPKTHPRTDQMRAAGLTVFVHAPYIVNVATTNNRIRIPSRKLLTAHAKAAAETGASGLIVHGGHVLAKDDPQVGFDNWRKVFERQTEDGGFPLPVLIENTAGGDKAMTRTLDEIARLWDAVGEFDAGFVLDTCHAWAAGLDLATVVDDVKAITGRIDLVHCNNSRDEAGSARDRHASVVDGEIPSDVLADVVRAAGTPVILETPGGPEERAPEIDFLRGRLG
jgi:deoxyribonuclease-4